MCYKESAYSAGVFETVPLLKAWDHPRASVSVYVWVSLEGMLQKQAN